MDDPARTAFIQSVAFLRAWKMLSNPGYREPAIFKAMEEHWEWFMAAPPAIFKAAGISAMVEIEKTSSAMPCTKPPIEVNKAN